MNCVSLRTYHILQELLTLPFALHHFNRLSQTLVSSGISPLLQWVSHEFSCILKTQLKKDSGSWYIHIRHSDAPMNLMKILPTFTCRLLGIIYRRGGSLHWRCQFEKRCPWSPPGAHLLVISEVHQEWMVMLGMSSWNWDPDISGVITTINKALQIDG